MVNVFDFGAVGDGVTDDTAALEHALKAGDGVLRLHKGTYRISRPLVLDLARQGWGGVTGESGTTRIVMTGPGPALRLIGDHHGTAQPSSVRAETWERTRFPLIADLEIVGEHDEAVGIELNHTLMTTISRVLVRRCRYGIHLVERNRNFILAESHLYDNREFGLFFDRCNLHQANIIGNHISYNRRAGIMSRDGDVHNVQITGNDIEYNNDPERQGARADERLGAEIWFEAGVGAASEIAITGNTIQATVQPGGANVRILGSPGEGPTRACLITLAGNVIGSQTRSIELDRVDRVAITGNSIYDSAELSLDAARSSGLTFSGNTLIWRSDDALPPRDGLRLVDCDSFSISGLSAQRLCYGNAERGAGITLVRCRAGSVAECQILDPWVRGIELEDCSACRVANCTVIDRRESPRMMQAIRVLGSSRDNWIHHNMLGGAIGKLIDVPDNGVLVQDNVSLRPAVVPPT